MSGADFRVTYQSPGGKGLLGTNNTRDRGSVDASSTAGGDYTNAITVDNQTVYVTAAGLKSLRDNAAFGAGSEDLGYTFHTHSDPGALASFFAGDAWPEDPTTIGKLP